MLLCELPEHLRRIVVYHKSGNMAQARALRRWHYAASCTHRHVQIHGRRRYPQDLPRTTRARSQIHKTRAQSEHLCLKAHNLLRLPAVSIDISSDTASSLRAAWALYRVGCTAKTINQCTRHGAARYACGALAITHK